MPSHNDATTERKRRISAFQLTLEQNKVIDRKKMIGLFCIKFGLTRRKVEEYITMFSDAGYVVDDGETLEWVGEK